jgi:DNA-directed RNA polymerase
MATVNASLDAGITNFHMIHDSYGTLAADCPKMAEILREEFIKMYSQRNLLEDFKIEIASKLPEEIAQEIPDPPRQGSFDLETIKESMYFFI